MGLAGCQEKFGWSFPEPPFEFARSCDIGELQSQVLVKVAHMIDKSGSCHFRSIMERLPAKAQEYIQAASPNKKATVAERSAAYTAISEWVEANKSWIFPADATSWCDVHARPCPVRPVSARAGASPIDGGLERGISSPLRISAAGVCCQGWSNEGGGYGTGHPSEAPHAVYLQERKQFFDGLLEDLAFNECTPRYPAEERMQNKFGNSATVVSIVTGPELFGWPCKRLRKLTAMINKGSLVWLGPDDISQDFGERFHKATALDGEILFMAPDDERHLEYSKLAATRFFKLNPEHVANTPKRDLLQMLLPPGAIARLAEWREASPKLQSENGVLICDVDHSIRAGSQGGADWPVQLTHGSIMCLKGDDADNWNLATGLEHFTAMGFRMHQPELGKFGLSKLRDIIADLPPYKQKALIGNGMHLLTQCSFMLYILANVAPVDFRLPQSLSPKDQGWEEFESDEFL
jgi:hypothetical protein